MQLEVGSIVEGKVTGITKFGAFIELPGGKTGMVHISEVSNTYVKEISDHLSDNQVVKVKVLSISDDGKISLSIKKCLEPPQQPAATQQPQQRKPFPSSRGGGGRGGNVGWNPKRTETPDKLNFEDMLANFKKTSDDKMSDLKRGTEVRRSSRRGSPK
jgi:S1 RNA binding domain protein